MNHIIVVLASLLSIGCAAVLDWRIVGGSKAEDGQFPYQVYYTIYGEFQCGGSIINEDTILTAAHCVFEINADDIIVVAGTNKLLDGGEKYRVKSLAYHKNFTMREGHNDVAVLKIDGKMRFNDKVQSIPLETNLVPVGADLVMSGWGRISFPGPDSYNLLFLNVKRFPTDECNRLNQFTNLTVDDTQLCTFRRKGQGSCKGDSGGPLAYKGKIAGINSWSPPCARGTPDVFTKVSAYLTWILKHM